ncbi:MAG TPA: YMGG-like glycine zipper-containing protein [Chitinophagaceae bacterium]
MKKLIPLLSVLTIALIGSIFLASCGGKADLAQQPAFHYADTAGLAAFQQWKTRNELKDPAQYYQQPTAGTARRSATPVRTTSASSSSGHVLNSTGEYPAKTMAKKGWSRKAKGAVIGGGGGAIIGALVNRNNRVVGGALGGALGAGIGYIVGNELDKKHGR